MSRSQRTSDALVAPGDQISVLWPMDDGSTKLFDGVVTQCKASRRKRHGDCFRYTIRFADGDVRKSRLRHLTWRRLSSARHEAGPRVVADEQRTTDCDRAEYSGDSSDGVFLRRPAMTAAGYFPAGSVRCPFSPELRYSVTPEPIGRKLAERLGSAPRTIIDGFAGVGGNAIQFALAGHFVIAVEIDAERVAIARHNARVYGVEGRIDFVLGDFMLLASSLRAHTVFLSPPWGGPGYSRAAKFSIKHGMRPDGHRVFDAARQITSDVVYYLPRNVDRDELRQLGACCVFDEFIEVRGTPRQKAVTAYFGQSLCSDPGLADDCVKLKMVVSSA